MKRLAILLCACAPLLLAPRAEAEIQKSGSEVWPGKIMLGADPVGFQLSFTDTGAGGNGVTVTLADHLSYKFNLNVAGIIASPGKVTLWLGGELNAGGRVDFAQVEPGLFVQITLEKLVTKFPLVPIIRAGFSGPVYIPYGYNGAVVGGAFQIKVGGGAYYFLTKNIGLGATTNFAFGPGFLKVNGAVGVGFAGYWDFGIGARFAF